MKNMKKVLGVALCATMALSALPVSGSLTRPAVVKAAGDTLTNTTLNGKVVVNAAEYNKVQISAVESNDLSAIFTTDNAYKYAWVESAEDYTAIKMKFAGTNGVTELNASSVHNGVVDIDRSSAPENALTLVIVKTKNVTFSGSDLAMDGFTTTFTRAEAPSTDIVKFDNDGNLDLVNTLEYVKKTQASISEPEKKGDVAGYTAGNGKVEVAVPAASTTPDHYLVRTKNTGTALASAAIVLTASKAATTELTGLKYRVNQAENKLAITKGQH